MNKQITLGQMLGSIVALLIAIIGGWVVLKTEVATLKGTQVQNERRIDAVETKIRLEDMERKAELRQATMEREEMLRLLYEIKVEMEKKKNR